MTYTLSQKKATLKYRKKNHEAYKASCIAYYQKCKRDPEWVKQKNLLAQEYYHKTKALKKTLSLTLSLKAKEQQVDDRSIIIIDDIEYSVL